MRKIIVEDQVVQAIIGGSMRTAAKLPATMHFDLAKKDHLWNNIDDADSDVESRVVRNGQRSGRDFSGLMGEHEYAPTLSLGPKEWVDNEDSLTEADQVDITGYYEEEEGESKELTDGVIEDAFLTVQDSGRVGKWISCNRTDVTEWEGKSLDPWRFDARHGYVLSFYSAPPLRDQDQIFYTTIIPIVGVGESEEESDVRYRIMVDYKGTWGFYMRVDEDTYVPMVVRSIGPIEYYKEHRIEVHRSRNSLLLKPTFDEPIEVTTGNPYPISANGSTTNSAVIGFKKGGVSAARIMMCEYHNEGTIHTNYISYPPDEKDGEYSPVVMARYWGQNDGIAPPYDGSIFITPEVATDLETLRKALRLKIQFMSDGKTTPQLLEAYAKFPSGYLNTVMSEFDLSDRVISMSRSCSIDKPDKTATVVFDDKNFDFPRQIQTPNKPITLWYNGEVFFKGFVQNIEQVFSAKNVRQVQVDCVDNWKYLEDGTTIGSQELKGMTVKEAIETILDDAGIDYSPANITGKDIEILEDFQKGRIKTKSGMKFSDILTQINKSWTPDDIMGFDFSGDFYAKPVPQPTNVNQAKRIFCMWDHDPGWGEYEWNTPKGYRYIFYEWYDWSQDSSRIFNEIWVIGRDSATFRPIIARLVDYNSIYNENYPYYVGYRRWYAVYNTGITNMAMARAMAERLYRRTAKFDTKVSFRSFYDKSIEVGDVICIMDRSTLSNPPYRVIGMEVEISRKGWVEYESPYADGRDTVWPESCVYTVEPAWEMWDQWVQLPPSEWSYI